MDNKTVYIRVRICVIALGLALALAWPVAAQDVAPQGDDFHANSVGVMSGELPAPLPSLPGAVSLPDLTFPNVDRSEWPTTVDTRQAIQSSIESRLYTFQSALGAQYDAARANVNSVRSTTSMVADFVGNPQSSLTARSDNRSLTVTQMAQEMSNTVATSIGYARAVSNIGPLGLDLVFVFIALGWMLFVNLLEFLVRVIAWFIRMIGRALELVWKVLMLLSTIIRLIVAVIDLFLPW